MSSSIILLGASGYVGQAFVDELSRRGWPFVPVSRRDLDYTRFDILLRFLQETAPAFLINAAGCTGSPNVDACEASRSETLLGNAVLPHALSQACDVAGVAWGHVSSGCLYSGARIVIGNDVRIEKDLTRPELQELLERSPEVIRGFTESDPPNFSFRDGPCSFYSGSKALGEEAIFGSAYVWRLRIPFDQYDHARNYLSKLQRYPRVYDNVNSISHRADFVRACLDLWDLKAPFGTYNMTNPGFVTTRQVVAMIQQRLHPPRNFEFWENDEAFYRHAAKTPRSNCVLDVSKLLATGVRMRPIQDALDDALIRWRPAT
jgi:dTDP-4-dehydrorhamnose reductase